MKKPFNHYPISEALEQATGLTESELEPVRAWLYWCIIAPVASLEYVSNLLLNHSYNFLYGKRNDKNQ